MGVKSLWSLLTPVGRPVMLETVEGKSMAIDSSIWIYQFQATMRDKDGRALVNAHVLGFLRRICKLLFYGIKPVFVFDGGAPALKRLTIAERKKKKSGAADSHAKIAEKLLAAQLRKEALNHAQRLHTSSSSGTPSGKSKVPQGPVILNENTVFLEDLDGSNLAPTPAKSKGKGTESSVSSAKKSRWRDHDPYRLPEVDMDAAVAKATRANAPDPRLATEDELRAFIDMMRPEDLDVTSSAFRELPTEVQYEIIGDLRLRSRQTSYKRLQAMLRNSRTALEFSKAQIQNLKQRNALTQQLLETTDSIGKANVSISVRIASERNREYVLVKNEGEAGGWVLGIRDDGTQNKPIVIDQEDDHLRSDQETDEDDDLDMEEVAIPQIPSCDPDLHEYQRELALRGIAKRQTLEKLRGRSKAISPRKKKTQRKQPLFIPEEDDEDDLNFDYETDEDWENTEDVEMAAAVQESLEDQEAVMISKAIEESRKGTSNASREFSTPDRAGPSHLYQTHVVETSDSEDDLYPSFTPSRLDTALRFANTNRDNGYGVQNSPSAPAPFLRSSLPQPSTSELAERQSDSDENMEEVVAPTHLALVPESLSGKGTHQEQGPLHREELEESVPEVPSLQVTPARKSSESDLQNWPPVAPLHDKIPALVDLNSVEIPVAANSLAAFTGTPTTRILATNKPASAAVLTNDSAITIDARLHLEGSQDIAADQCPDSIYHILETTVMPQRKRSASPPSTCSRSDSEERLRARNPLQVAGYLQPPYQASHEDSSDEAWSHPPSPDGSKTMVTATPQDEGWDAAQEMDVHEETGEFARFAAQVKGKDLDSVRREIDEEIRQLHQQRKAAMRDSEDVTQTMIAQIMTMLRLFGIPYITAPMEAEAQCAALVELGLVDGIITDDSDVFLFGGARVFKNMFNQAKTVECFLLADLARELGLDRSTLVRLAYLLGSDYVEGLPGVGPVVAMELFKEFPGEDGLHKFKDWWLKVQTGHDKDSDNVSTFRKRFKKRFKDLYLPSEWPNPAVRDAYYHPVVDSSEEPFKWGLPDLDGLRNFFREELSWNPGKVDELLLPIIHKMNRREQEAAANRQGTLNDFFSVTEGSGPSEPRKRQAYASRRLQALVAEHRKAQKQKSEGSASKDASRSGEANGEESEAEMRPTKKRRKKAAEAKGSEVEVKSRGKGRASTRGRGSRRGAKAHGTGASSTSRTETKRGRGKAKSATTVASSSEDEFVPGAALTGAPTREIALRKRVRPRPAYKGGGADVDFDTKGEQEKDPREDEPWSEGSEYQE